MDNSRPQPIAIFGHVTHCELITEGRSPFYTVNVAQFDSNGRKLGFQTVLIAPEMMHGLRHIATRNIDDMCEVEINAEQRIENTTTYFDKTENRVRTHASTGITALNVSVVANGDPNWKRKATKIAKADEADDDEEETIVDAKEQLVEALADTTPASEEPTTSTKKK